MKQAAQALAAARARLAPGAQASPETASAAAVPAVVASPPPPLPPLLPESDALLTLLPSLAEWDERERADLEALLAECGGREGTLLRRLLQRLCGSSWPPDGLPSQLPGWEEAAEALPLLLSPSLLGGASAEGAAALLAALRGSLERRLADAEAARAAGLVPRLLRLLQLAGGVGGGEALRPLLAPLLALLSAALAHHAGPEDVAGTLQLAAAAGAAAAAEAGADDAPSELLSRLLASLGALSAAPARGGRTFFLFAPGHGGLTLRLGSLPACNALTLLLRFKLEPPEAAPPATAAAQPLLRPLFSLQPAGLLAAVDARRGSLLLRCGRSLARTPPLPQLTQQPGGWHSLALVLARSPLRQDSCALYVDGKAVGVHALPFPAGVTPAGIAAGGGYADGGGGGATPTGSPPMRLRLGVWDESPDGSPGGDSAQPAMPPLCGALGCVIILAHACSPPELAALAAAAAAAPGPLPPSAALGAARPPRGLPPHLLPALLCNLDPRAAEAGGRAWGSPSRHRPLQRADPGRGVRPALTSAFADSLCSLGGPSVLLPLFAPPAAAASLLAGAGGAAEEGGSSGAAPPLPPAAALPRLPRAGLPPWAAAGALALAPPLLSSAAAGEGIAFVRALLPLLQASPDPGQTLSPALAAAALPCVRRLRGAAEAEEAAGLLLLNLPLWRRAQPPARAAHVAALRQLLIEAPAEMAAAFAGEFLLMQLRAAAAATAAAAAGGRDSWEAEERTALLRLLMEAAEDGGRPGVRAAASAQLLRFVHLGASGGAPAGGAAQPTPAPLLIATTQLLIALLAREGAQVAPTQAPPPTTTVRSLLAATALGPALVARLAAHPEPDIAALAPQLAAQLPPPSAEPDSAAAAAAASALLRGSGGRAGLAARQRVAAAVSWSRRREARAGSLAALRALAACPSTPWPVPAAGGRDGLAPLYWRLEEGLAGDGGRRRLLPLQADAGWASAARRGAAAEAAAEERAAPAELPRADGEAAAAAEEAAEEVAEAEAEAEAAEAAAVGVADADGVCDDDADEAEAGAVEASGGGGGGDGGDSDGEGGGGGSGASSLFGSDSEFDPDAQEIQLPGVTVGTPGAAPARSPAPAAQGALTPSASALSRFFSAAASAAASAQRLAQRVGAAGGELMAERAAAGLGPVVAGGASEPLPPWAPLLGRPSSDPGLLWAGRARWIRPDGPRSGVLRVLDGHLVWGEEEAGVAGGAACWPLARCCGMQLRRARMERTAIEFFFVDARSALFDLQAAPPAAAAAASAEAWAAAAAAARRRPQQLHAAVLRLRPPAARAHGRSLLAPARLVERAGWTRAWRRRELSNFEYLGLLNAAAGRSVNDLSQYPVYPWVISDYTSAQLDLSSPAAYRDLAWPVGCQTAERRAAVRDAFEANACEPNAAQRFHFGTHYSTPGGVMHLLLRLEPFASAHVQLQSNTFDWPDRLLHSVAGAYQHAAGGRGGELVPEWFTCADAFRNANRLPLGVRSDGDTVGDVLLPPWADGSAERFVTLHRAALESDIVSQQLHRWIDLVFGVAAAARGAEAEAALNTRSYSAYEGQVDLRALAAGDANARSVFEDTVEHFGQTPMALFRTRHPARGPPPPQPPPLQPQPPAFLPPAAALAGRQVAAIVFPGAPPATAVGESPREEATLYASDALGRTLSFRLLPAQSSPAPQSPTSGGGGGGGGGGGSGGGGGVGGALLESLDESRQALGPLLPPAWPLALLPEGPSRSLAPPPRACAAHLLAACADWGGVLGGGWWDGAVLLHARPARGGRPPPPQRAAQLPSAVLCTALAVDGAVLCVGGSDGAVRLWRAPAAGGPAAAGPSAARPAAVARGHTAAVTALAACARLDSLASGGGDGRVLLHSLGSGMLLRSLWACEAAADGAVLRLALSPLDGSLAAAAAGGLRLWSCNGVEMARCELPGGAPLALAFGGADARFLLAVTRGGGVSYRHPASLAPLQPAQAAGGGAALTAAALSPDASAVVLGLADGSLGTVRVPPFPAYPT